MSATGVWPLDLHAPMGIMDNNGKNYMNTRILKGHIPYRCLYSRNVGNLLMAGRNASVTHVALGTVRVEGQCSVMGQPAGTRCPRFAPQNHTTRDLREVYE